MKLYTEEQVRDILSGLMEKHFIDEFLQKYYTPIELPSDEEIGKDIGSGMHDFYKGGFIEGAKWMRDKILNK